MRQPLPAFPFCFVYSKNMEQAMQTKEHLSEIPWFYRPVSSISCSTIPYPLSGGFALIALPFQFVAKFPE